MEPPPPWTPSPLLMEDLLAEILVRLPPDEPAHLARAALVCKPWCRLLSDPFFRRRYRAFHGTPPLLGYLHDHINDEGSVPLIVPTTDASPLSPPAALDCYRWWALDCRHGRVLIHTFEPTELVVWDPITDGRHHLPVPAYPHSNYSGAVLCAADGCDHLDCHDGPFLVVYVGTDNDQGFVTWASVYSSETGAWSALTSIDTDGRVVTRASLLVGDALYFTLEKRDRILKFDLGGQGLYVLDTMGVLLDTMGVFGDMLITTEDGGLGFATVLDNSLHLWSWRSDSEGTQGWVQYRSIDLEPQFPNPDQSYPTEVMGFAEATYTIFINTEKGVFALELKSGHVRKILLRAGYHCHEDANMQ